MTAGHDLADPRARRTRAAILRAFAGVALSRRYDAIRIADLVAASGVGRATFYEHFRSKDELLIAAMEPILLPLAGAATGRASVIQLRMMLHHVWRQRAAARVILSAAVGARLQRQLAAMIQQRLEDVPLEPVPARMRAAAAAAGQLALLRAWLAGKAACPADALATYLAGPDRWGGRGPAGSPSGARSPG